MDATFQNTLSEIIQMHLDSGKIYDEALKATKVEILREFLSDFRDKHIKFATLLAVSESGEHSETVIEHAPMRKQEEKLYGALEGENEFQLYDICLHNERSIMKRYEDALARNDNPGDNFQQNLETITTIVRRLERAKTVPSFKNILVDL